MPWLSVLVVAVESSVATPAVPDLPTVEDERKAEKDPEFWMMVPLEASRTSVACTPGFFDSRARVSAKASAPLPLSNC